MSNNNSTYNITVDKDGKIADKTFEEFSKPSVFSAHKYDQEDKKRMNSLNLRKHSKVSRGKKEPKIYSSNNLNSEGISGDNMIERQQRLVREKELKQEQKLQEELNDSFDEIEETENNVKITNNKKKSLTDFL